MDKFRSFTFDDPEDSYWNEVTNLNNEKNVIFLSHILFL